jgi:SAM-dependent methyltransferase
MFKSIKNKSCRICNNKNLFVYLNLGKQPPSNSFIKSKKVREKKFPLKVQICQNCGLSQLDTIVSARNIFKDYVYLSSTSKALVEHYKNMTDNILKVVKPNKNSLIIDIGSNDGITLQNYNQKKFRVLGVEPSSAAKYAVKKGIKTEKIFFNYSNAKRLKKKYSKAKIITATNVFAHNDKIQNFVKGIKEILDPDGAFIIEFPYIDFMLKENFYDTIYHEHYSYLSISPLNYLFKRYNFQIFKIDQVNLGASGPALRVYIKHSNNTKFKNDGNLKKYLSYERRKKFKSKLTYKKFEKKINKININLTKIIKDLNKKDIKVGAFGAPAKGNTLLNTLKLNSKNIIAISENNSEKIGKFSPGSKIKIVSDEMFNKWNIKYALLLSWNYKDFFLKKSDFIKNGGKFIIPFPKPYIIGK